MAGFLFMATRAAKFADDIGERPYGIPGKICRSFTLQVYSEFRCDGYGKVVYFMGQRVYELIPA